MIEARYLKIDGRMAYVEELGSGPSVLCLHTAGQSGVQWRSAAGELAERGFRVIVPDLPGHGRSEPAATGAVTDLGNYARWCEQLLTTLGHPHPYLVGCSIGGKIVLDMVCHRRMRFAGAVVMAAEAGPGRVGLRGLYRELQDVAAPSRADRTYFGTLAVIGRSVAPERAELIATMHRREDPEVSTSDLIGWGEHDVRDLLAEPNCPVRLVAGADDLWIDESAIEYAASVIPGGHFTRLHGIGHYPMEEMAEFGTILNQWLDAMADIEVVA